jgi:hypothetical protein
VLVSANPKDSTLNFRNRNITLTFNEYIDLQNAQDNLLFTPLFENVPIIEVRLKTLNIRIRDTLEPNTTYTFNFGSAIKDVNEGNPFKEFTYTFSTGPYLDSLQLSGRVLLAENGRIDSTLTVVLHKDLTDSAVVNKRPRYAARLDTSGRFVFRNLPRETFAIYAIGDAGTLRRYTSPSQLFAFGDSTVVAGSSDIVLYAYREADQAPLRTTTAQSKEAAADKRLRIGNNLNNSQHDILTDLVLRSERGFRNLDTAKLRLYIDTVFTPVNNYTVTHDSARNELRIATAWQQGTPYRLVIDKDFAEDSTGRKLLKADTVAFATRKTTDYGQLRIRVRNIDTSQNPVLQFVQGEKVDFATPIKSGSFASNLFLPGEYELRILYDRNNNGVWDPGDFFKRLQPELVVPIGRKVSVKPDWENEFDVGLP